MLLFTHLQCGICLQLLLHLPGENERVLTLSLSHYQPPLSMVMPQSGGRCGGEVWARQIQVFIERSYGMTEESHYLLIKYWSWAVQVLTSKLIWADPWDQWLGVCVCACLCVHVCLCETEWERCGERERRERALKWEQVERAGERERNDHNKGRWREKAIKVGDDRESVERVDCVREKWSELNPLSGEEPYLVSSVL